MNKMILCLALLGAGLSFANNSVSIATPNNSVIANGLYKSVKSNTFIKIFNQSESELIFPVVAHRTKPIENDATVHGTSFDERLVFKRTSATTYVSTHKDSSCIATLTKVSADAFTIKVNSIDQCFNKHSQFNAIAPESDQTPMVAPFIDTTFKLDNNPNEIKYFSVF